MKAETTHVVREGRGNRQFVTRQIAGETLIVPIAGGVGDLDAIYTLNEIGSRVWQLIDEPTAIARIVSAICEEYDVAPDQARRDVFEFLTELEQAGLVREATGPDC